MPLKTSFYPLKKFFQSIALLSFLFCLLRLYEMFAYRSHLLDKPLIVLYRLAVSFTLDFGFFLMLNSLYILIYLILFSFKKDVKFYLRRSLFFIINFPIFVLFFVDMQTLAVQGELFGLYLLSALKVEYILNAGVFIKDYFLLSLVILKTLFAVFIICFLNVERNSQNKKFSSRENILVNLMIPGTGFLLFLFIFFNNTIYYLPYHDDHKYNGVFKRLSAHFSRKITSCGSFVFSKKKAEGILSEFRASSIYKESYQPRLNKTNVILFVLESLRAGYINKEFAPFISGLAEKGLYLKNHFSTSKGTLPSVSSILTGSLFPVNLRKINYLQFLRQSNYTTALFFGDQKDFFLHPYIPNSSIQKYWTREDYERETGIKNHRDKEGNVLEDYFLQFSAKKIKLQSTPFFNIIITNQPHAPYYCASGEKLQTMSYDKRGRYCLRYVDSALKNFFEEIKGSPFFESTLFIITGDHTGLNSLLKIPRTSYYFHFNVPLIFYHPQDNLKQFESQEVSHHSDIMPTLIDYFQLPYKYSLVHNSLFKHKKRFVITSMNNLAFHFPHEFYPGAIRFMDKDYVLYCQNNRFQLFKNDRDTGFEKLITDQNLKIKYETFLKSVLTYSSF